MQVLANHLVVQLFNSQARRIRQCDMSSTDNGFIGPDDKLIPPGHIIGVIFQCQKFSVAVAICAAARHAMGLSAIWTAIATPYS